MRRPMSLSQQNAVRLALVFMLFEGLAALAVVVLLMLPMAQRATADLAGLMVLSAQTWSELPPDTRPALERELASAHELELAVEPPADAVPLVRRGPYLRELEVQLARRTRETAVLLGAERAGETWLWAGLPSGGQTLWLGFPHGRIGPRPMTAILLTLAAALTLAVLTAWWLGRRTVAPLERFEAAAAVLGQGGSPELLPETGPRELAALARRFNRLALQVRELLEARTTLLAGLSHDLRTPLARMRLALEMLARRPEASWIDRLDRDIEEMNGLVGEVMELARGLGREDPAPFDLRELLEELTATGAEAQSGIEVDCTHLRIDAPPGALRRILGNLLTNARRYGGDGSIELCGGTTPGGWRIGVLDRGPGIPKDQIEAVFRPFHRVDASRSPITGGSGLGLAIVRQLAQANGMRVHLENRTGGGLAAWIEVPTPPNGRSEAPGGGQSTERSSL